MTNIITFALRGERTASDLYKDTAIKNGYKEKVVKTISGEALSPEEIPAGAYSIIEDSAQVPTVWRYKLDTEVTNPITMEEFGKKITDDTFSFQDAELAGEAETIRAKKEYNLD